MVQEAVDLYKRMGAKNEPTVILAIKLSNLCEPLAGGAWPQLVCVEQHEPHVGCPCGDGVPLNRCDLLLSTLAKVRVGALMNFLMYQLAGPG